MKKDLVEISIPSSLYKRIEEQISGSEFSSVAAYVVSAIDDKLSKGESKKTTLSEEDEKKIRERLKALGYMD